MDNLSLLRLRRAELKIQIDQQTAELKKTMIEIREEVEPANLVKKAVSGLFGSFKTTDKDAEGSVVGKLPAPLGFVADLLIKDRRIALLVKMLAPLAIKLVRRTKKDQPVTQPVMPIETAPEVPAKPNMYGKLRRGISKLRNQLKKNPPPTENPIEHMPKPSEN